MLCHHITAGAVVAPQGGPCSAALPKFRYTLVMTHAKPFNIKLNNEAKQIFSETTLLNIEQIFPSNLKFEKLLKTVYTRIMNTVETFKQIKIQQPLATVKSKIITKKEI